MTLSIGQILNHRYRIVALLGHGVFGAVYRVWDLSLNKVCAIKENLDASPEAGRQFQREATMLASLQHPNLPRVTDYFFLVGQGQYLVIDLIEGEDLQTMLDRLNQPLPEAQALNWIEQICDALNYLHSQSQPIIHRDIKPANIKITPQGKAVLVDFGIAKIYDAQTKTTVAARAVTPGYSPPEQYDHTALTDACSDIYALGATLYTLLTKHEPIPSIQRLSANLPALRSLNPNVSPHVEKAILTAMEMQTTLRYSNAKQFQLALTTRPIVLPPTHTIAMPPTVYVAPDDDASTTISRLWKIIVFGGLPTLLLVAVAVGSSWFYNEQQHNVNVTLAQSYFNATNTQNAAIQLTATANQLVLQKTQIAQTVSWQQTSDANASIENAAQTSTASVYQTATASLATEQVAKSRTAIAQQTFVALTATEQDRKVQATVSAVIDATGKAVQTQNAIAARTATARANRTATAASLTETSKAMYQVQIYANQDWQDTRFYVNTGQIVVIEYKSGKWSPFSGLFLDGQGCLNIDPRICNPDPNYPDNIFAAIHAVLIGRIGNTVFTVGNSTALQSPTDGFVYLRINDKQIYDNSGFLNVALSIRP